MVEVSSPVSGLLEKVVVRRGDKVNKGQVVARLESDAEKASTELAQFKSLLTGPSKIAEAKLAFAEKKLKRRAEMSAENLLSIQDKEDAEAEVAQARAELIVAQENKQIAAYEFQQQKSMLTLRSIRSPFAGVVVDQMAYGGEVVEAGGGKKGILKLAQLDPLRVRVILPMKWFGKIAIGDSVTVIPEIPENSKYMAKVAAVDRVVDSASGTFVVFLKVANKKLHTPSGVKCKAEFN